jgi:hypothetical protein
MQTEGFRTIAEKPSADACTLYARDWWRAGNTGHFRVFSPSGRLWYEKVVAGVDQDGHWEANQEQPTRDQIWQKPGD